MPLADAFAAHARIGEALAQLGESLRQVTVQIRNGSHSHGSGVIWTADGTVVTNAHVVSTIDPVVELSDGRTFPGRIVRRDVTRDLAVLHVDAKDLPAAVPASGRELKPGTLVLALGHPFGVRGALSLGVLHDAAAPVRGRAARWLRADVRLAPGNSGGPLANIGGRLLGLNTMIVDGLAYAIPSTLVGRFAVGDHERATLGVIVRPVVLRRGAGAMGFLVLQVVSASGAEAAGLTVGDVLTAISGEPFQSSDGLSEALESARPGDRLHIELIRGFERITRDIVLGKPPARPRAA
jgi:serine protease Do